MLSGLVGRDREMALVSGCVERAGAGQGSLVVCVGEPGIGKTRFAQEVARLGRQRGFRTSWGRAAATGGAPPFWPWRELLLGLQDEAGDGDAALPLTADDDGEPSFQARMRRFEVVCRQVSHVAEREPLLLVLDDLHAADESSQLLAQHLARTTQASRMLLLVTCRDTPGPLAALAQEPSAVQLVLHGLARQAAGRQMATILGRDPSEAELRSVYDATGGNPFFVAELARQVADGSRGTGEVPRSVRDAIGQRVSRLSSDCAATLQAAAIIGSEFGIDLIAAVAQRSAPDCLAPMDEAIRAALLLPGQTAGSWRFSHDLVRDAIVANLDGAQRVSLHRRVAETLELLNEHRPESVLFDLAQHWAQAAVAGDRTRAVYWIERAGRAAMRLHAYEDGRRWFSTALAVGSADLDGGDRCALMLALAEAQSLSANFAGALQTCGQVVDLALRLGRADLAGAAALVPEPTFDPELDQVIRDLCERALGVLDPTTAALRARVLAQYAVVCDHLSDLDAAHQAVEEALVIAEGDDDPGTLEAALTAHHMVRSGPDRLAERESNADRMWALGIGTGSATACLAASEWRFDAAGERGDLARAARQLQVIERCANRVGGPLARWRLLRHRSVLAQARGQYDDAYRLGTAARHAVPGYPPAFMLWSGLLAMMCHHTGQTAESLGVNGVTDVDAGELDWPIAGVVLTLGPAAQLAEAGRLKEAALIYRRLGPATDWLETPHAMLFTWAIGIGTAVTLGADEDVATLRAKLGSYRGHHIVNGRYAMAYFGPAELWLGVGAAHLGLFEDAVADLEQAVKACADNGAEGFRAEAEYELASALVRRSGPGDLSRARSLVTESLRRMDDLGMPPIRDKAIALLARTDADPSVGLTRRELEVAELVAGGLTNREVAARLYISERTAQNHVQHILDKLDLRNRSQVARWLRENRMSRSGE